MCNLHTEGFTVEPVDIALAAQGEAGVEIRAGELVGDAQGHLQRQMAAGRKGGN